MVFRTKTTKSIDIYLLGFVKGIWGSKYWLIQIVGSYNRNDIGGMRFLLNGFSEMLIKFEYKFELPQFWIEKTYLTWMIVDIVQHQNKLYHIKGPWEGNHKHTNSKADKTDQIISNVKQWKSVIVLLHSLHIFCGYFRSIRWHLYLKTSHMRHVMKWIGWRISEWYHGIGISLKIRIFYIS